MTRGRRTGAAVGLAALTLLASGCGEEESVDEPTAATPSYGEALALPDRSAYPGGSETEPEPERARVRLTLDSGARVALWIDPDDIRRVVFQSSDPEDSDDSTAWSAPQTVFTAGDGCLGVSAVTDGTNVAATLECYEDDAWIQQAPDQGQAAATADLVDWDLYSPGELFDDPLIADGTATWPGPITWVAGTGFTTE